MTALPTLLTGDGSHANIREILKGIEVKQMAVRPDVAPHSIYEELWHVVYWQRLLLEWVEGRATPMPQRNDDWPIVQGPKDLREARDLVRSFFEGVNKASVFASDAALLDKIVLEKYTVRSLLETLLSHNSYHLGRIVFLRQLIGIWHTAS